MFDLDTNAESDGLERLISQARLEYADTIGICAGLKLVNSILAENFVRPDEANKAQSLVREKGKHTFIDKVKVRYVS